ncbi:hypothetical protein SAMN05518847_102392 [Paenibacillus sp. OV219]|nr:hypothetical protein SAMN05518847_102392 [Paenibacillus sp. OV219]
MIQKLLVRLRNKGVLVSLFSGVILILTNTGTIDVGLAHQWDVTFNIILSMLVGLGVIGDPESHVTRGE